MCANAKDVIRRRQDPREIITDRTHVLTKRPEAAKCLQHLFQTDPSEDRNKLKRKKGGRAAGTCEWILGTEELTAWLGSGQTEDLESQATQVLWLHGNPGSGKSTMAIFLTEELSMTFSATDGKSLASFFCDSGFDKRRTATSVVRGLLLQLVQQHPQLLDYLLPKYNERKAELFNSFDALWTMFMAAAADQSTGRKYCIIDALDECDQESQQILLRQFEETFQSRNVTSNIRILVTSRPYSEIRRYLKRFANRDLASFPQTKQDIDQCIEERVADLAERNEYPGKVKQQVSDILRDKAEGTFLWVGLAYEELKEIPLMDAVRVVRNMPKGLHSLYKTLVDTALEQKGAEADVIRRILSFVAVCLRPLSVIELSEACQVHLEEEDVDTRVQLTRAQIASCRLMVIIQGEQVILLHQSVKDFLVGSDHDHFINVFEAHADLAYRCVDVLIEQFCGRKQLPVGFSAYATRDWANHARMAQTEFEIRDSQAEFFETNSPCREQWLERLRSHGSSLGFYERIPQQFSILHVAGRWGASALVDYVSGSPGQENVTGKLARCIDFDFVDASGVTPLEQAVWSGHPNVVSVLLSLGSKVTARVVKAAAGNYGNGKGVMTLLLDQRGDQVTITEEVVEAAARNRGNGKEVMALLLDRRGDQVTITEEVVEAAAGNYGNGKEVMALLHDRRGDQVTITEEVVKAAAGNEFSGKEVMALLFGQRGEATKALITQETLAAAATCGQDRVLDLISQQSGLIPVRDEWRRIAKFYNAAKAGNVRRIEQLLHEGIKADTKNIRGVTPLWIAAAEGHDGVVRVLARRTDVNVNSMSTTGKSPLFWPSSMGDERVVAILMEAGADPGVMDGNGDTAVTVARKNGHGRTAKMLERLGENRVA